MIIIFITIIIHLFVWLDIVEMKTLFGNDLIPLVFICMNTCGKVDIKQNKIK